MVSAAPRRMLVGISGASGAIYGVRLLELLRAAGVETHLILSDRAAITLAQETGLKPAEVQTMADHVHRNHDLAAAWC